MNQLTGKELKEADYVRNIFAVSVPPSVTPDMLKKPAFWAHVSSRLHPTDRIEVTVESGEWFAELYVVACGRNWAQTSLLRFHELTESKAPAQTAESLYYVAWRGQNYKHTVMRKSDKAVIREGFDTKDLAEAWIAQHEKTVQLTS